MKPFDLEEAKAGKPVCTRDGRPARIICFDRKSEDYPIVALLGEDERESKNYTTQGLTFKTCTTNTDLMIVSEKHEGWINLYHGAASVITDTTVYRTKEQALSVALFDHRAYIKTIKIEWEEVMTNDEQAQTRSREINPMLDKACEWLMEIENGTTITNVDDFVEGFRKAMEK